jgi:hypothetical protein
LPLLDLKVLFKYGTTIKKEIQSATMISSKKKTLASSQMERYSLALNSLLMAKKS